MTVSSRNKAIVDYPFETFEVTSDFKSRAEIVRQWQVG